MLFPVTCPITDYFPGMTKYGLNKIRNLSCRVTVAKLLQIGEHSEFGRYVMTWCSYNKRGDKLFVDPRGAEFIELVADPMFGIIQMLEFDERELTGLRVVRRDRGDILREMPAFDLWHVYVFQPAMWDLKAGVQKHLMCLDYMEPRHSWHNRNPTAELELANKYHLTKRAARDEAARERERLKRLAQKGA